MLLYILFICIILIAILSIATKIIMNRYNKLYENYATSFLNTTSNIFPKREKVLSGSLPTKKFVISDVQAIDNDILTYEKN